MFLSRARQLGPLIVAKKRDSLSPATLFTPKVVETRIQSHWKSTTNQLKMKVGDFTINYSKLGIGSHVVLLLPGAFGTIDTDFGPQLTGFDLSKFTIIAWDPPGYGLSRPPDRDFSGGAEMYYRDASTVGLLMKELKQDKYSVMGWSDGATTALMMPSLFPETVEKLVLIAPNAFINDKLVAVYKRLQNIDELSPQMRTPMIETYGEDYFRKGWQQGCNLGVEIHSKGGDICTNELPSINCSTLIVQGLKDSMVGMEHAEYLREQIKNCRLHIFKDGKHNLHLRYSKEFNYLVQNFLVEI